MVFLACHLFMSLRARIFRTKSAILKKAIHVLQAGGVVAHATETCYGFACDAFSEKALERLYKLKKMVRTKPVSIMVYDLKMARRYGKFSVQALALAKKYWPGPLTIIVKRKKTLPRFLNPGIKTIGIRVPDHAFSRELVRKFGRPLTTTSANISGKPSPYSVFAIKKQFRAKKPDLIINFGRLKKHLPSTIIDLSRKKIKIIRRGEINIG